MVIESEMYSELCSELMLDSSMGVELDSLSEQNSEVSELEMARHSLEE
jgi:hypothetical protein